MGGMMQAISLIGAPTNNRDTTFSPTSLPRDANMVRFVVDIYFIAVQCGNGSAIVTNNTEMEVVSSK
eukprot:scaffold75341_cov36-Attheya_sp.AAC.2